MQRIVTPARPGWIKTVESQGLLFHSLDDEPYWDETAYYLFESREIDALETASYRLNEMCLAAVDHVISERRLAEFDIPEPFHAFVVESWERDEHTIYGRFDLVFNGRSAPKLLEYNADTPTSLLEAAVIQWFWSRDLLETLEPWDRGSFDQFNSLHERLIEAWTRIGAERGSAVAFAAVTDAIEDLMTVSYLRDTAMQAGLRTQTLDISQVGWHDGRREFTDLAERFIPLLFKLYPWEWLMREAFGPALPLASTRWLEPPWKMILSNKTLLPLLYELFPESPYVLPAAYEPVGSSYVMKPVFSREGENIEIIQAGQMIAWTDGRYHNQPVIYQEFCPLPCFDGRYPVIGSWMVNGHACGLGVREGDGLITTNTSRFVPHLFRKTLTSKPPCLAPPV